MYESLDFTL